MADFLIKNTDHWMDSLTSEQIQQRIVDNPAFEESYNTRYQKGDVLEVAENNRWQNHQHGNGKFLIVRVPFLDLWQAQAYVEEWEGVHRRRYRMWFETISEEQLDQYRVAPFVYALSTIDELLLFGQDKLDEA